MKTQFGPSPNPAAGSVPANKVAVSSGQTAEAVKAVVSPAKTGGKPQRQEPEATRTKPRHPALDGNARLTIEKDRDTGKFIYKTINRDTGEVIRQWPREKMLKAIGHFRDSAGVLVDKKV